MAPQDGKGDESPSVPTDSRESLVAGTTTKVIGALSEPRSFLLFIFAVMALIEYTNYIRGQALVTTVLGIIETTTSTVSREQDFNRDMMEGMLRIIENDERRQQQLPPQHQPAPYPLAPAPSHPSPNLPPTHEPYPDQIPQLQR